MTMKAAPTPCTTRAINSSMPSVAAPHSMEVMGNTALPANIERRRPGLMRRLQSSEYPVGSTDFGARALAKTWD